MFVCIRPSAAYYTSVVVQIQGEFSCLSCFEGCPFSSNLAGSAATELVTRCVQVMHDAGCDEVLCNPTQVQLPEFDFECK